MNADAERIAALFREFERSAFRLEVRQTYTIPSEQERVKSFLAGDPKPDRSTWWHDNVLEQVAAGKTIRRAKVVRRPLTDYTRFLFSWGIPDNIRAGEDYRIVDQDDVIRDLPSDDFWLFDDKAVVRLVFEEDGTLADRQLIEDEDLSQYLRWRELAWDNGVPFAAWDARA